MHNSPNINSPLLLRKTPDYGRHSGYWVNLQFYSKTTLYIHVRRVISGVQRKDRKKKYITVYLSYCLPVLNHPQQINRAESWMRRWCFVMVIELYLGPHQYTVTCVFIVNNIYRNHSSSLTKQNVFNLSSISR